MIHLRIAVCPGSFDPVTFGHRDIIHRASMLFDKVIVLVAVNKQKTPVFTPEERVALIRKVTAEFKNVEVDVCYGLIADYVRSVGAVAIVKGLRAVTDFEYEFQMALVNKNIYDGAETVFLTTSSENMYLSSSVVKQVAYYGGDISKFVPRCILKDIEERLCPHSDIRENGG
ncbi:MAG: pantetheine-phosphate adenylyltransferase [Oscillospiraceae bacterium]|nr:pantetheine-phosphate adenylyltransferase [Oscillospiraceae bacterium]